MADVCDLTRSLIGEKRRYGLTMLLGVGFLLTIPLAPSAVASKAGQVRVAYESPKNSDQTKLVELLKEHRSLEKLQSILNVFRLPKSLLLKAMSCDESNAWYENNVITICYEYLADILRNAPKDTTPAGVSPVDAVVGPFFDVTLHEFGHALFDIFEIPVLGREEDAADQVAAYILLHFSKEERRRLIAGTAYTFHLDAAQSGAPTTTDFADDHGTSAQRFYNVLCIAYGFDREGFAALVDKGYLPKDRAEGCEAEYASVDYAFHDLLGPHVDRREAKKQFRRRWLPRGK